MTIPKYNELFNNVLLLFSDTNVEYKTRFVKKTVADRLNLSYEERNQLKSTGGETLIENRIGWTLSYLKKAGLLESKKLGYVNITEEGLKISKENPNITEEDLLKIPAFYEYMEQNKINKHKKSVKKSANLVELDDNENLTNLLNQINLKLEKTLLKNIEESNLKVFDKTIRDLLINMNYLDFSLEVNEYETEIIGVVNQDYWGLNKFAINASKSDNINLQSIQNFAGFMVSRGLTKGIFISTNSFDEQIIEYINNQPSLKISLIDGKKLSKLLIKFNIGVSIEEIFELKKVNSDYFTN